MAKMGVWTRHVDVLAHECVACLCGRRWRMGDVTDRPVLPRPYEGGSKRGVMVLEGEGILARGTGSCT